MLVCAWRPVVRASDRKLRNQDKGLIALAYVWHRPGFRQAVKLLQIVGSYATRAVQLQHQRIGRSLDIARWDQEPVLQHRTVRRFKDSRVECSRFDGGNRIPGKGRPVLDDFVLEGSR